MRCVTRLSCHVLSCAAAQVAVVSMYDLHFRAVIVHGFWLNTVRSSPALCCCALRPRCRKRACKLN